MPGLNIQLGDDGTLDTIVHVSCMKEDCDFEDTLRFNSDMFSRGDDGIFTEEGWSQLEQDVEFAIEEEHDCPVEGETKFTIGEVSLTRAGMGWPKEPLGDERVSILRAFYLGQDLHGWIPVVINPLRRITKDQVNWDTAGEAVTENKS